MAPDPPSRPPVFSLAAGRRPGLVSVVAPPIEGLLGLRAIGRRYARLPACDSVPAFIEAVFDAFGIRFEVADEDLARIPATGPAVVVANHPYGGVEGMALGLALLRVRPDVKIMANRLLGRIPELRELFVFVDPFEGRGSQARSLAGLREAARWLARGGLLAVFPAGEVAHFHVRRQAVVDPPWQHTVARLIRRAACPTVPVHFTGRNGALFQVLGMVHPALRTAMLPRELLARSQGVIEARVGRAVPWSKLETLAGDREVIDHLRGRTEILAERPLAALRPVQPRRTPEGAAPLVAAVEPDLLAAEVAGLPAESLLAEGGGQQVWLAEPARIPQLLREIGRLRELTFRSVGEGTGRELDLDRFDETYRHLFLWHAQRRQVVGAYRIGRTDELLAADGVDGLYTSTLFRFVPKLFERMGPALEMGRSFIRPEHQRSFAGLLLLWRGIGEYVLRNPECATLFGPVSISADYLAASQQLIAAFLARNRYRHPWSRWVRPRTPFRARPSRVIRHGVAGLVDLDEVSQYIAELEADGKGAPILLKQYLKLGGRLLGFNVDPDFSDVLDVLVMVDLRHTEPRTLARYMGAEGAATFLAGRRRAS